ncbi:hypothetical protein LCGC14_1357620 [marine sediment metagenome]|uniref:Uncharacterized protein n=1 Tax=marine sediment metagenome TaxID=412755 RepID=A0A0F9KV58_9ZZZZ
MTIALQILRFSGILWLAIVFAKAVARIETYSSVLGFSEAMSRIDWIWLTIGLILAIALISGTTWLIDKQKPG